MSRLLVWLLFAAATVGSCQAGTPEAQLHQLLMRRLSPSQFAAGMCVLPAGLCAAQATYTWRQGALACSPCAGKTLDVVAPKQMAQTAAAAEPGLEALSSRGSSSSGGQSQPSYQFQQQQGSKDPATGPKPGSDVSGFTGGLRDPPPPITSLGGSGPGNLLGSSGGSSGSSNGGAASKQPPAAAGGGGGGGDVVGSWPAAIKQLGNPSCIWVAQDQTCMPTQVNWMIAQGVPSSPYRR